MTTMRPSPGSIANCTFEPPVSTPISRSTAIDASRMRWYSLSVSVCAGATVIESPVWMPIGSRFSIEHTMMQLSRRSRTTSISNSFQPSTDSSIEHLRGGGGVETALADLRELLAVVRDAAAGPAEGERGAHDGGKSDSRTVRRAASSEVRGPAPRADIRARCGPSRRETARGPRPCRSPPGSHRSARPRRRPARLRATRSSEQLSAVWPPIVGSRASGRSFSMMRETAFQCTGSM